jgi:hypothetical protein
MKMGMVWNEGKFGGANQSITRQSLRGGLSINRLCQLFHDVSLYSTNGYGQCRVNLAAGGFVSLGEK